MEPLIRQGSILQVGIFPTRRYEVGDIVVFLRKGKLVAHRIIGKKNVNSVIKYLLKGDNSHFSDGYFSGKEILGLVENIEYDKSYIDLNDSTQKLLKYLFVAYSRLNKKFEKAILSDRFYYSKIARSFFSILLTKKN